MALWDPRKEGHLHVCSAHTRYMLSRQAFDHCSRDKTGLQKVWMLREDLEDLMKVTRFRGQRIGKQPSHMEEQMCPRDMLGMQHSLSEICVWTLFYKFFKDIYAENSTACRKKEKNI